MSGGRNLPYEAVQVSAGTYIVAHLSIHDVSHFSLDMMSNMNIMTDWSVIINDYYYRESN
jgi:hypothetical protein